MLPAFPSNSPTIRTKEIRENKGFQLPKPSGGNSWLLHKSKTHTLHNIAPETKKQLQLMFLRFLCKPTTTTGNTNSRAMSTESSLQFFPKQFKQSIPSFLAEMLQMHFSCEGQQQLPLATACAPRPLPGTQLLAFFKKQLRDPQWDVWKGK